MSLNDVISSDEFQNRFGTHTRTFQEFAAYILIMSREYTDLSVREVGAYVKNLMDEKHKLELDLAEAHSKFSQSAVQAAVIAGQADEIKKLKLENGRLREAHDPPICRLQLPDGRVPGNAREAAEMWHDAYIQNPREIGRLKAVKERFYAVMKELLRESLLSDVEAEAYVEGRCDPVMRAQAVKNDAMKFIAMMAVAAS